MFNTSSHSNYILSFSKSALYASLLFLLHHGQLLKVPIELLYLGVLGAFVTFRMMITVGQVSDPLLPLESPFTSWLFGSASEETNEKGDHVHKQE